MFFSLFFVTDISNPIQINCDFSDEEQISYKQYKKFNYNKQQTEKHLKMSTKIPTIRAKRMTSYVQEVPANTPKFIPKKSLTLSDQRQNDKDLRETDVTISEDYKIKSHKNININHFQLIRFLGNGRFGTVYLARHLLTNFLFAMKIINKPSLETESEEESQKLKSQLIQQIKLQLFLCHPNIVKLYTFFHDQYKIYLLLELAPDGHLYEYMKDQQSRAPHRFGEDCIGFLIREILQGVQFMHEKQLIHRDLKPENIVLVHGVPKICDFGWSVYCPKQFRTTLCGTPLYLSPEILIGDSYNQKIDSWAIGTLAYELLTGDNPFSITKKSQMSKIITEKLTLPEASKFMKDFLANCLEKQPTLRISTKKMLSHPFILKYEMMDTCQEICKKIQSRIQEKKLKTKRN